MSTSIKTSFCGSESQSSCKVTVHFAVSGNCFQAAHGETEAGTEWLVLGAGRSGQMLLLLTSRPALSSSPRQPLGLSSIPSPRAPADASNTR